MEREDPDRVPGGLAGRPVVQDMHSSIQSCVFLTGQLKTLHKHTAHTHTYIHTYRWQLHAGKRQHRVGPGLGTARWTMSTAGWLAGLTHAHHRPSSPSDYGRPGPPSGFPIQHLVCRLQVIDELGRSNTIAGGQCSLPGCSGRKPAGGNPCIRQSNMFHTAPSKAVQLRNHEAKGRKNLQQIGRAHV